MLDQRVARCLVESLMMVVESLMMVVSSFHEMKFARSSVHASSRICLGKEQATGRDQSSPPTAAREQQSPILPVYS